MFIFKRVSHLRNWIADQKKMNTTVGFVPTMGALHQGHISLVQNSIQQCDHTVVSIFVNPLQFNDPDDLKKYPRPIEQDIHLIYEAGTTVLFIPEVTDMYPPDDSLSLQFNPGLLGEVMEGQFRPGHFRGVAEVVYRLLKMVEPDKLFLGQKDFQQVAVIRQLIIDQHLPVDVVVCPTLREDNGLAMSSRNVRLSASARNEAGIIFKTLTEGKLAFEKGSHVDMIKANALNALKANNRVPEYFEIVDGRTLLPVTSADDSDYIAACTAVQVEGVRLIDNLIYKAI